MHINYCIFECQNCVHKDTCTFYEERSDEE